MDPISVTRPIGVSPIRIEPVSLRFGVDPSANSSSSEAPNPQKSPWQSLADETKHFFNELVGNISEVLQGLLGRFRHVLAAGGSALGGFTQSLTWTRTLGEINPEQTLESKAAVISSLTHAAFRESLLQSESEEGASGPIKDRLLYDLYSHVLRENPYLLTSLKEQPPLGGATLLSRLLHAHPTYDEALITTLENFIRDKQAPLENLGDEELAHFAEALIVTDTKRMEEILEEAATAEAPPGDDTDPVG